GAGAGGGAGEGGVRLGQGIAGQPGGEQHVAPVDREFQQWYREPPVPLPGLVQAGQRGREVPGPVGDDPTVVPGEGHLDGLAGGGVQVVGAGQGGLGPVGRAAGQV